MRFLSSLDVENKRVLVRADFNVPTEAGKIEDDFRIAAHIPTIRYLQEHKAKIILMSHLGEPKGADLKLSLRPVATRLAELLHGEVLFASDTVGPVAQHIVAGLQQGQVVLLENLRFSPGEKENDQHFIEELASFGDCYVDDAFSSTHRPHASIVGLPKVLPSVAGLLLQKEMASLNKVREHAVRPVVLVIGGAKVNTKLPFLETFIYKTDAVCLGGVIANTILAGKGIAIGKSFYEKDLEEESRRLAITDAKLHLPVDVVVSVDPEGQADTRIAPVGKMSEDEMILDIGPDTIKIFSQIMQGANTIIWNGPMGRFEVDRFAEGTYALAREIEHVRAYTVVGGGDVIDALDKYNLLSCIDFVSTGGGAMLAFLAGEKLPGIEALEGAVQK